MMQVYDRTRTKAEAQYLVRNLRGSYSRINIVPDTESLQTRWVVMVEETDREEYCQSCRAYHNPPTWPVHH